MVGYFAYYLFSEVPYSYKMPMVLSIQKVGRGRADLGDGS